VARVQVLQDVRRIVGAAIVGDQEDLDSEGAVIGDPLDQI